MKKWILFLLVAISLAGCGDFEWFPDSQPSSNPSISFTIVNQCGRPPATQTNSSEIIVSGIINPVSISVSGDASSKYSLDDALHFTNAPGTITSGQKVFVQHVTAPVNATPNNTIVITTLTIGGVNGFFKTNTGPCPQGTTTF